MPVSFIKLSLFLLAYYLFPVGSDHVGRTNVD